MTTPLYDELYAAYQHVVDSREKAVKEIMRLEHERGERAARLEEAQAEVAALRQALMDIRKDAHFAHVTVYTEGKWSTLCEEIKRRVDEVTPNGTAGAEFLSQYHHAAEVIKDLEAKRMPVNEYVARLETACLEVLAIAEGRQPGTWDDVMRLLRAVLPEILRAQGQ